MTEKLYESDSHMSEFTATVLSSDKNGGRYEIILDRTAFFPEGGGQCSDNGVIGDSAVSDVQIFDGVVIHYGNRPLAVGSSVVGKINWELRFHNMQHHTAEHIVSGTVHKLFGFRNVGFHLGQDVTMDFDGRLTDEDIARVEQIANEAVFKNVPVTAEYPPPEKLSEIDYRSKLDLTENVRIVTVEGYDKCACCAPHIAHTGEIGMIKLLSPEAYKGGTRLYLKCGFNALKDYSLRCDNEATVGAMLSANKHSLPDAVRALLKKCDDEKRMRLSTENGLIDMLADLTEVSEGNRVMFAKSMSADGMRYLGNIMSEKCNGIFGIFSGDDGEYNFVLSSQSEELKPFFENFRKSFGAKGGGTDSMMFGSVKAYPDDIKSFFEDN